MSEHVPFMKKMLYNRIVNEKFGKIFFRRWRKLIRQRVKNQTASISLSVREDFMYNP